MRASLLTVALFAQFSGFAQTPGLTDYTIKSSVFGDERIIHIYVPETYTDTTRPIAVAYLFDGQFTPYITMVTGMMEYYSQTDNCLPMIVVAVETTDRWNEFTPMRNPGTEEDPVYSSPLSDYLEKEVFPFVESKYKTRPFRLGIGHSLGGTFLLYEVFRNTKHFDAVIMASPNTTHNDLVTLGPSFLQKNPDDETFVYVAAGTVDDMENQFRATTEELGDKIKAANPAHFDWRYEKVAGRNHMETFLPGFDKGYLAFSEKWYVNKSDLLRLTGLKGEPLQEQIKAIFEEKTQFRNSAYPYTSDNLHQVERSLFLAGFYDESSNVIDLEYAFCETDTTLTETVRDFKEGLKLNQGYSRFFALTSKAKKLTDEGKYKEASALYNQAFAMEDVWRGTHMERVESLTAFAQSGNYEDAFRQMEMLAKTFNLSADELLKGNALLEPLHKDKRWDKYLKIIENNVN